MPSIVRRPNDLALSGPRVEVKLWVPGYVNAELAYLEQPIPAPIDAIAFIDTGATKTIIQEGIAERLGLTPTGVTSISTPISANHECYQYQIRLLFPQGIAADVLAVEVPWPTRHERYVQCLIGRDILKHSLLIYNGFTNTFTLIF